MRRSRLLPCLAILPLFGTPGCTSGTHPATSAPAPSRAEMQKQKQAILDMWRIEEQLGEFKQDVGRYPTAAEGLAALLQPPPSARNWNGPYLDKLPRDPWGHNYLYLTPATHNITVDLLSPGPDGQPHTSDDVTNWLDTPKP